MLSTNGHVNGFGTGWPRFELQRLHAKTVRRCFPSLWPFGCMWSSVAASAPLTPSILVTRPHQRHRGSRLQSLKRREFVSTARGASGPRFSAERASCCAARRNAAIASARTASSSTPRAPCVSWRAALMWFESRASVTSTPPSACTAARCAPRPLRRRGSPPASARLACSGNPRRAKPRVYDHRRRRGPTLSASHACACTPTRSESVTAGASMSRTRAATLERRASYGTAFPARSRLAAVESG